jgi:hypothetical protein
VVLLILIADAGWAVVGLVAGLAHSSAEPGGVFVDCGRAVFGRPAQLPNPACAGAYAPYDTISIVALTISVLTFLVALGVLMLTRNEDLGPVTNQVNAAT